jgi:DNA-binding LytR/AlgR family response regulator
MLRVAICDDNIYFTGELEKLIYLEESNNPSNINIQVFFDGLTLENNIQQGNRYDLIFLDIEMQKVNGIDAARRIRACDTSVLLIYISSHEKYLKELFEVEPFRFLSKPLNKNLFLRYYQEARLRIKETNTYYQFAFNKEIHKVALKDVIYFESQNRIIHIFLSNGNMEQFYGKLNTLEHELLISSQYFLRIHQSYLVNYDYIRKMNYSNITLSKPNDEIITLKISEDRQKNVRKQLCKLVGGKAVIV